MKRLRRTDITGQKFGMLTVIERNGYGIDKAGKRYALWKCKCECGNTATISQHLIVTGEKRSCGCLRKQYKTTKGEAHGMSHTRIYSIYVSMLARCESPTDCHYKDYGGRGIKVCEEWKNSFKSFYEWATTNGYTDSLTIDRINVNGNYEPSNCRWATSEEQQNNRRNNVRYQVDGELLSMKDIIKKYGANEATLRRRMKVYKISMQEAIYYQKPDKTITYKGETKTVNEWCKITGIKRSVLIRRIKNNYTENEIFNKPTTGYHGQRKNL